MIPAGGNILQALGLWVIFVEKLVSDGAFAWAARFGEDGSFTGLRAGSNWDPARLRYASEHIVRYGLA